MNEIASRYGLALFSISEEKHKVLELQQEVKELSKIFSENPGFTLLLKSSFLSIEERTKIIDKVLKGVDKDFIALLKIVLKNNRISLLDEVLQSFNSYCNAYRGVDEGLIYSISPLNEKTKKSIEKKISEIEKRDVELINKVDPKLIGGVKVVINDHIYDGSVKNRIENMKIDLLK